VITRWSEQQERMVLENATKLVFPTVGLRDHFTNALEFYNTKSAVVPHSFDSSLYEVGKPKQIRNSMHLVARLFGAFYGARKPDVLFSAIAGMELGEDINFTLEVYGPWHPAYEELHKLRGVGVNRRIVYRGHVPHVEALREMQDADLLVLVDAPGKGESFYLPSKLVDYMAARRPILALCREGVTRSIVKKLNGIVADPEDESSVHQGLEKWVKSRKDCFIANEDVLADHDAVKVGEKFRSLIREIV
jgi:glycosyltransferase involved in cell wall biosynthesis